MLRALLGTAQGAGMAMADHERAVIFWFPSSHVKMHVFPLYIEIAIKKNSCRFAAPNHCVQFVIACVILLIGVLSDQRREPARSGSRKTYK